MNHEASTARDTPARFMSQPLVLIVTCDDDDRGVGGGEAVVRVNAGLACIACRCVLVFNNSEPNTITNLNTLTDIEMPPT